MVYDPAAHTLAAVTVAAPPTVVSVAK